MSRPAMSRRRTVVAARAWPWRVAVGLPAVAALLGAACGQADEVEPATAHTASVGTQAPTPANEIRTDRLSAPGWVSVELPAGFEVQDRFGRLPDGSVTDGVTTAADPSTDPGASPGEPPIGPMETITYAPPTADGEVGGAGSRAVVVAFWRSGVDVGQFDPLDDPRFTMPAYHDSPPDPEWSQSVVLVPADDEVLFVNGRNLGRDELTDVAASLELGSS